jgi:multidrug resistance protein, MATE family
MSFSLSDLRLEAGPVLRLAVPLVLAELGWMAMGTVDMIMAGPLGAAAVGAISLGGMIFYPIAICGTGLLLGMDTLVAQAHGAGNHQAARSTLLSGLWLALLASPLVGGLILTLIPLVRAAGTNPHVLAEFVPYMKALVWSIPPLLVYAACRRYLQAVEVVKPVTFALVSANLVNFAGNWLLIYGHWGAPRMGVEGSGWSTTIARVYMAAVLVAAIWWQERSAGCRVQRLSWKPEAARLLRLLRLGAPAAAQILVEGSVFALVTMMVARLDEVSLAAHGIAINVASTTYMVPLGISSAAAVRVGQAVGRGEPRAAAAAGWTALLAASAFMLLAGLALWLVPGWVMAIYLAVPAVATAGISLLAIAALFELFDGLQTVATGALRGLGDTRSPMLANIAGYWVLGLPMAYLLCFPFGWGVRGIWVGLCLALVTIGSALLIVWSRRVRQLTSTPVVPDHRVA